MPDVEVTIGVDAAAVVPGAEVAENAVGSIAASVEALGAETAAQTKVIQEGFAAMAAASASTQREIEADSAAETASIMGVVRSVHEGVESFNAMKASVFGIGEAILAAFAFEAVAHFAERMGEAGENTEHLGQRLGMMVPEVQQLGAAFTMMGLAPDKGVMAMGRLDKAFAAARQGGKQQIAVFEELGVSIAHDYTQVQLLGSVMDGFKDMADGPAKTAAAMTLMGRSGAQMIPFLNLGREGLEELNRVTERYGVVNKEAVEKAAQLGSAFNENKVAMQGVNNVLSEALAPTFTAIVQGANNLIASFIKSYEAGGTVKTVMDTIVVVFNVLGSVLGDIFDVIGTVFSAFIGGASNGKDAANQFKDVIIVVGDVFAGLAMIVKAVFQVIGMLINQGEAQLTGLGHIVGDILTGQFGKMGTDWAVAQQQVRDEGARTAAALMQDWTALQEKWAGMGDTTTHHQMVTTGTGDGDTSDISGKAGKGYTPHMEYAAIETDQKKIEALTVQHLGKIDHLNEQSALRFQKSWVAGYDAVWSSSYRTFARIGEEGARIFNGLLLGQETWAEAFQRIGLDILGHFETMGIRMLASWAATEHTKTALSLAGASERGSISFLATLKEVTNNAVAAAGAAYKAMAGIPIIGPALGAAAAAATFAAVEGFGALASAAGGWGDIPQDQIAQVHRGEMVLPAPIAAGVRNAIAGGSMDGSRPAGGGGGDTHHWHIHAVDGQSVKRLFEQHGDALHEAAQRQARNMRSGNGRRP